MGRRGPPQWPPRAGLSLGPLAGSFLLGHSALRHNASGHFSAPWRATGGEVFPFPLDQVMRANGAEVTFIPLKMEAGRGREMRGGGRRGSKGQREEHRDGAVNVKGGTRGTVDVRGGTVDVRERQEARVGSGRVDVGESLPEGPGGLLETRLPLRAFRGSAEEGELPGPPALELVPLCSWTQALGAFRAALT